MDERRETTVAEAAATDLEDREQAELLEQLKRATIGEYDIYSRLGRGGMATVFLALELSLNRSVAIKVISPSALSSSTIIERFWLEARTAASLSHPNVIPIYSVRAVGGLHFFVMKHVQGGSLDVVLRNEGPFQFWLAQTVIGQVASALSYAHRRGVIHRDIKPANIMLDDEGLAVVMDFGIAKVRDAAALTASGSMVGTPFYMSPEQFSGDPIDGRTDQYSLGVVAFELLTGRRPFKGESIPEVLRGHLLDRVPDVREFRKDCPTALATLVNRMLCKVATDRFPTMEAVCDEIDSMPRVNSDRARQKIMSLARTASISSPKISQPISPTPAPKVVDNRPLSGIPSSAVQKTTALGRVRKLAVLSTAAGLITVGIAGLVIAPQLGPSSETNFPSGKPQPLVTSTPPVSVSRVEAFAAESTSSISPDGVEVQAKASDSTADVIVPAVKTPVRRNETRTNARKPLVERFPRIDSAPVVTEPTAPAPQPPPPPPPTAFGIGSRLQAAFLYVDGEQIGRITRLRYFQRAPGRVHLQIKAEDCQTWDTVLYLRMGDTATVGYRNPRCSR